MIVILADSSAYLSRAEAATLGAMIVSMTYSVDEGAAFTESYIEENGAYEKLIAQKIDRMHTSQVSLGSFSSAFAELCGAGHEVLCITMSSRLSGTYANACMAAQEYDGIEVVDSLTTGAGLFMLIQEARAYIDCGMTLKEVADFLRQRRSAGRMFFSVDDMAPLRRSGRISNVKMSVSTILNIKPLLKFENGAIVSTGIARGRQEQIRALIHSVGDFRGKLMVESFLADEKARIICDELRKLGNEVTVRKVGPVVAIHLGRGAVGIAWMEGFTP